MNAIELYNELDRFYQVRGDRYGYNYLSDFVNRVTNENVQPSYYRNWFEQNKNSIGNYEKSTLKSYQNILKQFIRYVLVVENISEAKKGRPKNKGIRIHDNFHTFKKENDLQ